MLYFILAFSIIVLLLVFFTWARKAKNGSNAEKSKNEEMRNFPFVHNGKLYWYSRSVAVSNFVFAKNNLGTWCILANKRGAGTPDYSGFWNVPCGYLDFGETVEEAAQRETFEETNVFVKKEDIQLFHINSDPSSNRQNVVFSFKSIMGDCCDNIRLSMEESEKNEVDEIKWIPLEEVGDYKWAFDHDIRIIELMRNKDNFIK